jgi:integrase
MATGKITKRAVESVPLPATNKRAYLWDDTLKGFGVMVTDRGARSYLIQYRLDGRASPTRRVTIGKHGSPWTAEMARDRAAELLEQVRRKVDPFDAAKALLAEQRREREDREREQAKLAKLAFSVVAADYVTSSKKTLRRWQEQERIIERDLTPCFNETPLPSISADDINDCIAKAGQRASSASLKAYSALRSIFTFAHSNHRRLFPASASPFGDVTRPQGGGKRSDFIANNELRLMWLACDDLGWPFGSMYRLLLLTGLRLREVAEGRWSEIDLEGCNWLIPAERMKNGEPHWVALSPAAVEIIKAMPRIDKCDLMFSTNGETAVSGFSRAKSRLDAAMLKIAKKEAKKAGSDPDDVKLPAFVVHDTRRTVARGCQIDGVAPEVIERMLGHVTHTKSGLKGVYQVFEFEDQRRAAFAQWGRRLLSNVMAESDSGKVVHIRGAAA